MPEKNVRTSASSVREWADDEERGYRKFGGCLSVLLLGNVRQAAKLWGDPQDKSGLHKD